jgi:TPP-dependent pyruvate/acetoin dehydrogenase alpha subunit
MTTTNGVRPDLGLPAAMSRLDDADLALLLGIRHFELALLDCFARGLVSGTTHTCLGQEYVPVALEGLLRPDDYVFSNHRGHGHYLARFGDPAGLLAEILGRDGAVCGGYGGSQHLLRDTYMSTGVQGESLSVAAGVAIDLAEQGDAGLACVYIGDGTWGEGAVYEALNLAAVWSLPLLVVVENNAIAQSTPTRTTMAGTIAGRAAGFGIAHRLCTSIDVYQVRSELADVVAGVRQGRGPAVVELTPPRLGPHSKGDDTRSAEELAVLRQRDWAELYRLAFPEQYHEIDLQQRGLIARMVDEVVARPLAGARDV